MEKKDNERSKSLLVVILESSLFSTMYNTSQYEDGSHNITAMAIDHEGLTNQTSIFVTFDNGNNNLIYYAVFIGGGAIVILTYIVIKANKKKRRKTNKGKGKRKKNNFLLKHTSLFANLF